MGGRAGFLDPLLGYAYAPSEENKKDVRKFSARFLAFSNEISTIQKIVLFSSRGQGNFRGLEASRHRTWPSKPRPRTSKCVLEAKNVFKNSTSDKCDAIIRLIYSSLRMCRGREMQAYRIVTGTLLVIMTGNYMKKAFFWKTSCFCFLEHTQDFF